MRREHDDDLDHLAPRLRRREALGLLGGIGAAAVWGASRGSEGSAAEAAAGACILSPEVTEGPYWIDAAITRRDITEDRPGLPLILALTLQDARSCEPIDNADVEIWHCDAGGVYSGFESASQNGGGAPGQGPTDTERYLRGHQRSDGSGRARFETIYPGWYRGRTPHIHLKVHVGGDVVHTGQLFFSEAVTAAVYKRAPYRAHGRPDTSHAADRIYAQAGRSKATLDLTRRGGGRKGYKGTIALGVAR
jgi:protocatechuate 3,4-dioxygenase beta subunit